MFSYDFRTRGNVATYGPSILFRVLSGIFFVFLTIGFISVVASGDWNSLGFIPLFIILLLLLCLIYRDSWIFDNDDKTVTYIWGFGPFVKKQHFKYSDIKRIEVTHFIKGIPDTAEKQEPSWRHRAQVVLSLRIDADTKYSLEIMGEKKSGGKLERNASWLSGFTGLALFIDRPRETKIQ